MKFNQHWRAVLAAYHSLQGKRWKFLPALCCHINKYWRHWLTETSYSMKTMLLHSWDPGAPSPGGTRCNFWLISWICRPYFNLTTSKFIQGNTAYQVLPRNQVFQITFRSLTLTYQNSLVSLSVVQILSIITNCFLFFFLLLKRNVKISNWLWLCPLFH